MVIATVMVIVMATVMVVMLSMTMLLFYITVKVSKVHDPSRSAVHTPLPRDGAGGRRKVRLVIDCQRSPTTLVISIPPHQNRYHILLILRRSR